MTLRDYDPKKVQEGYHHSWSLNPQPAKRSLEFQTGYSVKQSNSKEDYSEGTKSKYSEQTPSFSNDYFG